MVQRVFAAQACKAATSTVTYSDDSTTLAQYDATSGRFTSQTADADGDVLRDYVNDGQGNITTNQYADDGSLAQKTWQNSDGTSGQITYNGDGSYSMTQSSSVGSNTQYFNADGTLSYYTSTTMNANGALVTKTYDGTSNDLLGYTITSTDNNTGTQTIVNYTPNGIATGDTWQNPSTGSYGSDQYNADGSINGVTHNTDGSYSTVSNNGQGTILTRDYDGQGNPVGYNITTVDAAGNKSSNLYDQNDNYLGNTWQNIDGSSGSDMLDTEGSTIVTNDGQGTIVTERISTDGVLLGKVTQFPDGHSQGITYNGDGTSQIVTNYANGSYSRAIDDGNGNVWVIDYIYNGRIVGYSEKSSDGFGGYFQSFYDADGNLTSYSETTNDGEGNMSTKTYDAHGNLIGESDGSDSSGASSGSSDPGSSDPNAYGSSFGADEGNTDQPGAANQPEGNDPTANNTNRDGGKLGPKLSNDLGDAQKQIIDPLVVSMDGNTVTTTSLSDGSFVDYRGTGFAEKTSWLSTNAGILVDVTNPSGTLNDGFTIIGTDTTNQNGNTQGQAGFTQLAALDTNHDGVINASDTDFNQIEIWVGSNGQAGSGSLETLAQAGISSISLRSTAVNTTDANGDELLATSTITYGNGTTGTLSDMNMSVDTSNTIDESTNITNSAYADLPDIAGWGNVHNLQVAMALDTSGNLANLVQQYLAATPAEQATLINNLIFTWTGVENNAQETAYHFTDDTREIDALSQFIGAQYSNDSGWSTTLVTAAGVPMVQAAWNQLVSYVSTSLLNYGQNQDLLSKVSFTYDSTTKSLDCDVSGLVSALEALTPAQQYAFGTFLSGSSTYDGIVSALNAYFPTPSNAFENIISVLGSAQQETDIIDSGETDSFSTAGDFNLVGSTDTLNVTEDDALVNVSGNANTLNLNNATITSSAATLTLSGNGNLLNTTAGPATLDVIGTAVVNGSSDLVNLAQGSTVTLASGTGYTVETQYQNQPLTSVILQGANIGMTMAGTAYNTLAVTAQSSGDSVTVVTSDDTLNQVGGNAINVSIVGGYYETLNLIDGDTVSVSGGGVSDVVNMSNGTLTDTTTGQVTLNGNNNTVSASGGTVTVNGTGNIITVGPATLDVIGTAVVNGTNDLVNLAQGSTVTLASGTNYTVETQYQNQPLTSVTLQGANIGMTMAGTAYNTLAVTAQSSGDYVTMTTSDDTLNQVGGNTMNVSIAGGYYETLNLIDGDTVTVSSGTGDVINMNNGTLADTTTGQVTLNGNNDTVSVSGGTATVNGTGNTITAGPATLDVIGTAVVNGSNDLVNLAQGSTVTLESGTGYTVETQYQNKSLTSVILQGANVGMTMAGTAYNTLAVTAQSSGDSVTVVTSDDTLNQVGGNTMSVSIAGGYYETLNLIDGDIVAVSGGTGDVINMNNGTLTDTTTGQVTLNGNNNTVSANGGTVTVNGTGNAITTTAATTLDVIGSTTVTGTVATGANDLINLAQGSTVTLESGTGYTVETQYQNKPLTSVILQGANIGMTMAGTAYNTLAVTAQSSGDSVTVVTSDDTLNQVGGNAMNVSIASGYYETLNLIDGDTVAVSSGTGDVINMNNGTLADTTTGQVTLNGNNDTVSASGGTATVNGTGNTITAGPATLDVIGTAVVNGSNDLVNLAQGSTVTLASGTGYTIETQYQNQPLTSVILQGANVGMTMAGTAYNTLAVTAQSSDDSVTMWYGYDVLNQVGGNAMSVAIIGTNETANLTVAGDTVNVSGTYANNIVNVNSGTVTNSANLTTVNGNNDNVSVTASGITTTVNGTGNTITAVASTTLDVIGDAVVSGGSDLINLAQGSTVTLASGTGYTVETQSQNQPLTSVILQGANVGMSMAGTNYNTLAVTAQSSGDSVTMIYGNETVNQVGGNAMNVALIGSNGTANLTVAGDTVSVSGTYANNVVNVNSGTVTNSANLTTVNGNNNNVSVSGGATTVNGSSNMVTVNGGSIGVNGHSNTITTTVASTLNVSGDAVHSGVSGTTNLAANSTLTLANGTNDSVFTNQGTSANLILDGGVNGGANVNATTTGTYTTINVTEESSGDSVSIAQIETLTQVGGNALTAYVNNYSDTLNMTVADDTVVVGKSASGDTINMSNGTVTANGGAATVNGNSNTVTVNGGSIGVNGSSNTITTTAASTLGVSGDAVHSGVSGTTNLGANSTLTLTNGTSDSVFTNQGTSANLILDGGVNGGANVNATTTGTYTTINVTEASSGDSVSIAQIETLTQVGGNALTAYVTKGSDTLNMTVADDTVVVSGSATGSVVNMSNGSVTDSVGVLTVNGSGNNITTAGAATVNLMGDATVISSGATVNITAGSTLTLAGVTDTVETQSRNTTAANVILSGSNETAMMAGTEFNMMDVTSEGSDDAVSMNYYYDTLTQTSGNAINVALGGEYNTLNLGVAGDTVTVASGAAANTLNLTQDTVVDSSTSQLTLNGSGNTIVTTTNAAVVNLTGTAMATSSGATVNITAGSTLTLAGVTDTVETQSRNTTAANVILSGAGADAVMYGTEFNTMDVAAEGSGDAVSMNYYYDTLTQTSGNAINVAVGGEYNTLNLGVSGNTVTVASGAAANTLNLTQDTVVDNSTGQLTVNGSGNSITTTGAATVNLTGDATLSATGATVNMGANTTLTLASGSGANTVATTSGATDILSFGAGVTDDQLWFSRSGNNLLITVDGTQETETVSSWFSGSGYQLGGIEVGAGSTAEITSVAGINALVQAMASMTPPAAGQTTLNAAQLQQLAPVLAANWHS